MLIKELKLLLQKFPDDADVILQVGYLKSKETFIGSINDTRKTKTKDKQHDRLILISKCLNR